MLKFTKKLVLLSVLLTSRLTWTFPIPQEDEDGNESPVDEEEEEGEEEYFEEEEANRGTTITPGVYSTGDEEVDNYLKRNYHVKNIVSKKLGITNFTRQSLYEQGANALFSYIADRTKDQIPTDPPPPVTQPAPVVYRTRRYKVRQGASTSRYPFTRNGNPVENEEEGIKKTFEITVPNDITNNAGGTIEISIPTHLTSDSQLNIVNPNHLTIISKSKEDPKDTPKSIEEAIQQVLLLTQQRTGINISTVIIEDKNLTKTIELGSFTETNKNATTEASFGKGVNSTLKSVESLDITNLLLPTTQRPEPGLTDVKGTPEVIIVDLQTTPEYIEYVEYIEEEIIERTRKPTRVRTTIPTTTKASLNPIKALFAKQNSQTPGVSGFIFDSVINTTKSGARIAASAVWCALFDHCPDDKEGE